MSENRYVVLKARPSGKAAAGDFAIVSGPVPEPEDGQILVRNLYLSIDPGVRNLLGAQEGYLPPIPIGAAMSGSVLGVVRDSRHPDFQKDDLLIGRGALGDYSVITPTPLCWKVDPAAAPSLSSALGVLGNTGRTAYFGLLDVGQPQPGETVLVSGAAGGVGSLVGQIARIKGCRAVGIAGGAEKCRRLIEEFGFDAAVDYKGKSKVELSAAIAEACPDGVDVFFDNVGGPILDAALPCMNSGARASLCGMISQYDGGPAPAMENLFYLIARSVRVEGFLLTQFAGRYDEAVAQLSAWIAAGRLRYREEVADGLEQVVPTFLRLFEGTNQGKTMVKL
jgi:NADPH-dependent curcumin reductase CurA